VGCALINQVNILFRYGRTSVFIPGDGDMRTSSEIGKAQSEMEDRLESTLEDTSDY
jgi:hypothetical protein